MNVPASHGVLLNAASEIVRRRSYSDRGAFSEYLRGRHHASKFNAEDALKALECSERAVAIDPEFPRGWLGKAWAHNQLASFGIDSAANDRLALAAARRASELDPYDAEAWIALGEALGNTGELEAAEAAFDRAMRLGQNNADVLAMFSGWAALFGQVDEGVEAAEKALRLNPNWPIWYASAARRAYFHAGRYKEALSFVVRRQPKTRSLDDVVTAACCAAALGDPGNALQWRGEAMAMGFISAELYLDYAGIRRPEQRALVSQLIQTAGFDLRNKP